MQVLLQEERLVLQERLDLQWDIISPLPEGQWKLSHHAHQVDQDGQVVLHHVHAYALRDEGAESRQHLMGFVIQ